MIRFTTGFCCAFGLLLAGCQSYERQPLDLSRHADDWAMRSLYDARISPFFDKLDAAPPADFGTPDAQTTALTLRRAQAIALTFNPDLRIARLEARVPLVGVRHAGLADDPELSFDVLRIIESVDDPWIAGFGIGFTIPLSGRLAVAEDKAWAEYDTAWRSVAADEAALVAAVHTDWIRWSAAQAEAQLWREHGEALTQLHTTADQLRRAGEIDPVQARVVAIELATTRTAAAQADADADALRRQLLARLGLSPQTPVTLTPIPVGHAADTTDPEALKTALLRHPRVELAKAAYEDAEQALRAEIIKQYPDITIGPVYENDEGQSRIGLSGAIPIPLFNRNQKAIAEAGAARDAARARALRTYERLAHDAADAVARRNTANVKVQTLTNDVAPLIDQQLADMRKLIDLGELDALMLSDALERSLTTRLALLEATRQSSVASAQLQHIIRPLWVSVPAKRRDSNLETQP